jgi:hypothetical protein
MSGLLLRTFGTLVVFQLLALAVIFAGRRRRGTAVAVALAAALAMWALVARQLDPSLTWMGAVTAGWLVERGVRKGWGLGRLSIAGTAPVLVAIAVTMAGVDPAASWSDLRAQVDTLAGVHDAAPDSAATPEDRVRAERTQELARTASRWALRLLPVEMGVLAWVQVLVVIASARRVATAGGRRVRLPRPSRWQVPFAWIWVLAAGLALVATRQTGAVIVGCNAVALAAAVLAVQGAAVLWAAIERSPSPLGRAMLLAALALAAWPLFAGGLALVGAADLWVDFRRLRSAPKQP